MAMPRIRFKLVTSGAKDVLLVGDFTDWETQAKRMKRARPRGRTFETTVSLRPGSYEYKFIVDGEWVEDPKAEAQPNPHGTMNSVCRVPE
jgi:1,4-alpha-glucan branching enzyme